MKKISVIIPVYNMQNYIDRGMESLCKQKNFNDIEVIIVDDGSTDNTIDLCKNYIEKYDNIQLYHKNNGGVSSARNFGLKKSNTEYICFFDIDDTLEEDVYERLFNLLDGSDYDIGVIGRKISRSGKVYNENKDDKIVFETKKDALKDFFCNNRIQNYVTNKIFRKKVINSLLFDENSKIGEDMYFVYQAIKNANKIIIDNSYRGYVYHINEGSIMNSDFSASFFDSYKLSKRMIDDFFVDKELYEYAYAHYIYETYKVIENILFKDKQKEYNKEKRMYKEIIMKYSNKRAIKYLSKKKFIGFILIKYFEILYLFAWKVTH